MSRGSARPSHLRRGPVATPQPRLLDCQRCGVTLTRWHDRDICETCQLDTLTRKARR